MIFVACVVPIAVYCLVLAIFNRRRRPLIVSGAWDFAGVLFAASGILLLGGPAILRGLYEQWHLARLLGQTRYLQGLGELRTFWISLWLLYFAVVAGGSAFLMWRRRGLTSIYNIETEIFTEVLTQVLDRLGIESFRSGPRHLVVSFPNEKRLVALSQKRESTYSSTEHPSEGGNEFMAPALSPQRSPASTLPDVAEDARRYAEQSGVTPQPAAPLNYPSAELDLDLFPAMRHVTLRWRGQHEVVRAEIEAGLAEALALVRTSRNPVTVWFLSLALALFFSAFVVLTALIATQILQLRR